LRGSRHFLRLDSNRDRYYRFHIPELCSGKRNKCQALLAVADRAYVLEAGRIVLEGSASELKHNARVREAYLGR
jgi:hypothetical protein